MRTIAIVIPYYQREGGILRRALDSIYAQTFSSAAADHLRVKIVIVDDESPYSPELEIEGLARDNFEIVILKQANAGPAAARNTGLEHSEGADILAFLDSDDFWHPDHLSTALRSLDGGADFYFCNSQYSDEGTWFDGLKGMPRLIAQATSVGDDLYLMPTSEIHGFFIRDCFAHTSAVVYDTRKIQGVRFDRSQRMAGEDYLYWLDALKQAQKVGFCTRALSLRGSGIDLYRSALDWDNPECVRRLYCTLRLYTKILHNHCRTAEEARYTRKKISLIRRGIAYLFVRNFMRHFKANLKVFFKMLRSDPVGGLLVPFNMVRTTVQRLRGRLEFPTG